MFSNVCVFVRPKTHWLIRVHTTVFVAYSTVHTNTLENDVYSSYALLRMRGFRFSHQALDLLFPNGVMFWILFSNFNTCSVEIVYEYVNILQRRIETRRHLSGRTTKCSCFWPWQTNIKWQSHSKASTGSQFKASMAIYLIIRIIYVSLVDLGEMTDVIVFKSTRCHVSTLIRYVCVPFVFTFNSDFKSMRFRWIRRAY